MRRGADRGLSPAQGLRLLVGFARYGRGWYAASALLAVLGTAAQLAPYWAVWQALVAVVDGTASRAAFTRAAVVAALGVLVMTTALGASTWMSHRAAFATLEHLRLRIGLRLGEVPLGYLTRRRSGEVQRVLTEDVERLESFLAHAVPDLVSAVGVLTGTTVWLLVVDGWTGLAAVGVVVLAVPLMVVGAGTGADRTEAYARAMARMSGSVVEFVRALPVVRIFQPPDGVFPETVEAIRAATRFQADWGRAIVPVYTAFSTMLVSNVVVVVPVGLWRWRDGLLSTADLLFFLVLGLGYTASLLKLLHLTTQLGRLSLGAGLVTELDQVAPLPQAATDAVLGEPGIELVDVRFTHTGVDVLDDRTPPALDGVSLTVPPRTMTALVGPSGAGKSTLAKLVCRFWDVDAGVVRVAGADVRDMPASQLWSQVALVLQETFLFDDTVAANLRLGRSDATDAEIEAAARAARVHDVVTALPRGYATRIGECGARLSGGERQRLSIARALLKDASIVVLDEATAFVDPENEAALQDALSELVRDRTLLVIAHRLSTVAGADRIVVLEAGRVVEQGSHTELLAEGGTYAGMWKAYQAGAVR